MSNSPFVPVVDLLLFHWKELRTRPSFIDALQRRLANLNVLQSDAVTRQLSFAATPSLTEIVSHLPAPARLQLAALVLLLHSQAAVRAFAEYVIESTASAAIGDTRLMSERETMINDIVAVALREVGLDYQKPIKLTTEDDNDGDDDDDDDDKDDDNGEKGDKMREDVDDDDSITSIASSKASATAPASRSKTATSSTSVGSRALCANSLVTLETSWRALRYALLLFDDDSINVSDQRSRTFAREESRAHNRSGLCEQFAIVLERLFSASREARCDDVDERVVFDYVRCGGGAEEARQERVGRRRSDSHASQSTQCRLSHTDELVSIFSLASFKLLRDRLALHCSLFEFA